MRVGPKYKIARRLGEAVFAKTQTPKFALSEQRKERVQVKKKRRGGRSEYATQLIEKQKIRYSYGISERQLSNYVDKSYKRSTEVPQANLFRLLESRLDNVVFRLGFAMTRPFARQMVTHGHILLNGRRVNIPSALLNPGDVITLRPGSRTSRMFEGLPERAKEMKTPAWLILDPTTLTGTITREPGDDIEATNLNFGAVVEFYSRV